MTSIDLGAIDAPNSYIYNLLRVSEYDASYMDPWFLVHHPHLEPVTCPPARSVPVNTVAATKAHKEALKAASQKRKKGDDDDAEIRQMLAAHNKKLTKVVYEPRKYSTREVRQWEARSGRVYSSLSMQERHEANEEIKAMLESK